MQKITTVIFIAFALGLLTVTSAQICGSNQYYNGQRCAPCKANCKCSSQYGCDSCIAGYTFDNTFQSCVQCPIASDSVNVGCAQCCNQISGTSYLCSSCPSLSYTFLIGGQCIRLIGCSSLLPSGRCEACDGGYYLQDGACIQCNAACATCSDSHFCNSCSVGYFSNPNKNNALCSACSAGCASCTSATDCVTCRSGFKLSSTSCVACPVTCTQCTSSGCTSCISSATLVGSTCISCSDTGNGGSAGCQACRSQNSAIICTSCSNGYFINSNSVCQSCGNIFPNSRICTATQLIQCKDDYISVIKSRFHKMESSCVPNTNSCKSMADTSGSCSSCYFESGRYYSLWNGACNLCQQNGCSTFNPDTCACTACLVKFQFVNSQCIACQNQHCYTCQQSVTSCQECAPYYGLISSACIRCVQAPCLNCDGDTALCNTCLDGYYNHEGTCYTCQSSCSQCISSTECTKCASTHFLNSNGRCKRLPGNCISVDSSGICQKCAYGYQKLYGYCFPCSPVMFNMQQCQKFCPSFYAVNTNENHIFMIYSMILVVMMGFMI